MLLIAIFFSLLNSPARADDDAGGYVANLKCKVQAVNGLPSEFNGIIDSVDGSASFDWREKGLTIAPFRDPDVNQCEALRFDLDKNFNYVVTPMGVHRQDIVQIPKDIVAGGRQEEFRAHLRLCVLDGGKKIANDIALYCRLTPQQ